MSDQAIGAFAPGVRATTRRALAAAAVGLGLGLAALAPAQAESAPDSFADLAAAVSPSVVNITTTTVVATPTGPGPVVPRGSPFEDFFRDFGGPDGEEGPVPARRSGRTRWGRGS